MERIAINRLMLLELTPAPVSLAVFPRTAVCRAEPVDAGITVVLPGGGSGEGGGEGIGGSCNGVGVGGEAFAPVDGVGDGDGGDGNGGGGGFGEGGGGGGEPSIGGNCC